MKITFTVFKKCILLSLKNMCMHVTCFLFWPMSYQNLLSWFSFRLIHFLKRKLQKVNKKLKSVEFWLMLNSSYFWILFLFKINFPFVFFFKFEITILHQKSVLCSKSARSACASELTFHANPGWLNVKAAQKSLQDLNLFFALGGETVSEHYC